MDGRWLTCVVALVAACGARTELSGAADAGRLDATHDATRFDDVGPSPTCVLRLPAPDKNCAADFQNDPNNCGYCGHGCGAGQCVAGVCSPTRIQLAAAYDLGVIDQTFVFSDDYGTIGMCSFPDCSSVNFFATSNLPPALATYGSHIYTLGEDGALDDIYLGGVVGVLPIRDGAAFASVATNGTTLVMTGDAGDGLGRLHTCLVGQCAATFHLVTIANDPWLPGNPVTIDASHLYVWDDVGETGEKRILRTSLDGVDVEELIDSEPTVMWTDGCTLVWGVDLEQTHATNPITACSLDDCAATARPIGLIEDGATATGLAADSSGIYFTTGTAIWRLAPP